MWYEFKEDGFVIINIKTQPSAGKNEILDIFDHWLKVKIKAPAVDGAANKELVKYFSKKFKIPKSEIKLVSGLKSKQKRVRLPYNGIIEAFIKDRTK